MYFKCYVFFILVWSTICKGDWVGEKLVVIEEGGKINLTWEGSNCIINMDEDLNPDLTFLSVLYEGDDIRLAYVQPSENILEMTLKSTDDGYHALTIGIKVDYEKLTTYSFIYSLGGIALTVNIINIDNKTPYIQSFVNPCELKEEEIITNGPIYVVVDEDGWFGISPEYTLEPDLGIFKFDITVEDKNAYFTLQTTQKLDYETTPVYNFNWIVWDGVGHETSAIIVVAVQDIPDQPPKWVKTFTSQQFDEKEIVSFEVTAIDGDIMINAEINYKISCVNVIDVKIDETTGVITVNKIDRDFFDQEIFLCTITAYEKEDPTSNLLQDVTFLVNDVNDQIPEISFIQNNKDATELTFEIEESTKAKLPDEYSIKVYDRDSGKNAKYSVKLEDVGDINYIDAFQIVPNTGYQEWDFSLAIVKNTLLDYEEKDWQTFQFKIVSIEDEDSTHTHEKVVNIKLLNWNDEKPIFKENAYSVQLDETVPENTPVKIVFADDRDGDEIEYAIIGTQNNRLLSITKNDKKEGVITTLVKRAFDFETLNPVVVQITATEKNTVESYSGTVELTINLNDINDETPKISIPNEVIQIEENTNEGTVIQTSIEATDGDAGGQLIFTIIWDDTYFTKSGVKIKDDIFAKYKGCIAIKTIGGNTNDVTAELSIVDKIPKSTPDFELFDTMYIKLRVTDNAQTYGVNSAEALLTISVKDKNDNAPEFIESTIKSLKSVTEMSKVDTLISYVNAVDADGEDYNIVEYSIMPRKDTGDDLVRIDKTSGEIYTAALIQADPPDGYIKLYYTVKASDGELWSEANIEINVIDTNNNPPIIEAYESIVEIEEKSKSGTPVMEIKATDKDRDAPYNQLKYILTGDEINEIFIINDKGKITVGPNGPTLLNRDGDGKKEYTIAGTVLDNNGDETSGTPIFRTPFSFTVKLLDINDQKPKIVKKDLQTREDVKKGIVIDTLHATDDDELNKPNSQITLKVTDIKAINEAKAPVTDLFIIEDTPFQSPADFELKAGVDLETYYGDYEVTIEAKDHGEEPLISTSTIKVTVDKFNFRAPTITYPKNGAQFLLSSKQDIDIQLQCFFENCIQDFTATDNQDEKWKIKFDILPETNENDLFDIRQTSDRKARLVLKKIEFELGYEYNLEITATDNGTPESKQTNINIQVVFINEDPYPIFDLEVREQNLNIYEVTDVGKIWELPEARYIYDYNISGLPDQIFYRINNVKPNEYETAFTIESKNNIIKLISELDKETYDITEFTIITSRNENGMDGVKDESKMSVTVHIQDDNDNPPEFSNPSYYGSIMTSYPIDKSITTVFATDPDVDDTLTWLPGQIVPEGENLQNIKEPFKLNKDNGEIQLNFEVKASMSGLFKFDVTVTDSVHSITTTVKIFIIVDDNRLELKFENIIEDVEDRRSKITQILTDLTGYICNIESIKKGTDDNGNLVDTFTTTLMYFTDPETNEPVSKSIMQEKLTVISTYNALKKAFSKESLNLMSLGEEKVTEENIEEVLKAWLIGVSVGLGAVLIVLIIFFVIKIRSLTARLEKLTDTKFGSQESGLNRIGAPGTNMRAAEGANPVFNNNNNNTTDNEKMDNESIHSYESGLIGVENNADFDMNRRESINPRAHPDFF